jgi:hypothetical protein
MSGHSVWTYVSEGSSGRANPTRDESRFDRLSDLFRERDNYDESPPLGTPSDITAFDTVGEHVG